MSPDGLASRYEGWVCSFEEGACMKKLTFGALVPLVLGAAVPALAQTGPRNITIAMIGKSRANPLFEAAHRGAHDAAATLSAKHGVKVNVAILTPDRESTELQLESITKAVQGGVDAILLSPTDASRVTPTIDKAVEAGIPVMTFDNDAPGSKRFAHYGPNDVAVGERVMAELAEQIGGAGKVALLAGNRDAANLRARAEGVKGAAARLQGIDLVGTFYHEETAHVAAREMLRVNEENPDLKGWALIGGWPLFRSSQSLALLEDLTRRRQKVVSVDALPEQLVYVHKGLAVLLAQPVYDWGTVGVETIANELWGTAPVPERIEMELVRVAPDSLASWAERLQSWGFKVDPSAYR
jgi:ribose transport system substrate-binding protein